MNNFFLLVILLSSIFNLAAQKDQFLLPEENLQTAEIRAQLEFLASDFLMGRRTNSPGNETTAVFLAAQLKAYGYETPEGQTAYHQRVPLLVSNPPDEASLTINNKELILKNDFLILSGSAVTMNAQAVFAGYGWVDEKTSHNDYEDLDVKDKVVFVLAGPPGAKGPNAVFEAMAAKKKFAKDNGALALFELYQLPFPWAMFASYFGGESMKLVDDDDEKEESSFVYGWLNKIPSLSFETIQTVKKLDIKLSSSGTLTKEVTSPNVIGILEGSDAELKEEYILLTAHFDHVGVGEQGGDYTPQDSIFNGARDNGIGVVALMAAAKSLAAARPSRSIIVLALTGEEVGLLGSKYYANHPLIPLEKVVFNFNTDGAGYTDTSAISIVGWGRTGTDDLINKGAQNFGLKVIANPVPEMHLFDRSDNVSFAQKGVPCLSLSPGFSEFGEELMKNYHQVSDDTTDLDWEYIKKYCQVYAHTARLLANAKEKPKWTEGDKYETAGKELYKN